MQNLQSADILSVDCHNFHHNIHVLPVAGFLRVTALSRILTALREITLDDLGSNPGGDEIFHLSRPALGLTHPPVKWVQGRSRGESAAGACC